MKKSNAIRRKIILLSLRMMRSEIPGTLKEIRDWYSQPKERQEIQQKNQITKLLAYASTHVPYYKEILPKCGVVNSKGEIRLEGFKDIPFLTKKIIQNEYDKLISNEFKKLKVYESYTGGSTGEPLKFLHTQAFKERDMATKFYYYETLGKYIGEPEVKIWGSERDFLKGGMGVVKTIQNKLYNRTFINGFAFSEEKMIETIKILQKKRPKMITGYVDLLEELGMYISNKGYSIKGPKFMLSEAGTLTELLRKRIEKAFSAPVMNHYGGREGGTMAGECREKNGLHVFEHAHFLEVVNNDVQVFGERGEIVVTPLFSYAMPFIRYKVGDLGILHHQSCRCGWDGRTLKEVTGRVTQMIYNPKGDAIPPEFFIHIIGVTYNTKGEVKRFQVVQDALDEVKVRIVLAEGYQSLSSETKDAICSAIRKAMGKEVTISIQYTKEIPKSTSGKFMYVKGKTRDELFKH